MNKANSYVLMHRDLTAPIVLPAWPQDLELTRLQSADARAVHGLLHEAYANGFGAVAPDWLAWWEQVAADSEFDPNLAFVVKADGRVIGFCLCWTSSFVKDLVVAPDWQGRGVGTALLAEAMAGLKARRAAEVRLKVDVGNAGARRLYERIGFEAVN